MKKSSSKYVHLAPNPKSFYKQLFIKGTRTPAEVIFALHASTEPRTPEEIATDYGLPLEAVKEAIAYCESNPPELAADYDAEEVLMEATGMNEPNYKYHPSPKLLAPDQRARLNGR